MLAPLFTAFCIFALVTLGLAASRQLIIRSKGDDCLHLLEADAPRVQKQATSARWLNIVDGWGKSITVLTLLLGVASYVVWWLGE